MNNIMWSHIHLNHFALNYIDANFLSSFKLQFKRKCFSVPLLNGALKNLRGIKLFHIDITTTKPIKSLTIFTTTKK